MNLFRPKKFKTMTERQFRSEMRQLGIEVGFMHTDCREICLYYPPAERYSEEFVVDNYADLYAFIVKRHMAGIASMRRAVAKWDRATGAEPETQTDRELRIARLLKP